MQRWRYHSLIIRDLSICEAKLNAEGEKGWELVSLTQMEGNAGRAFFKMPIEEGYEEPSAAYQQPEYSRPYPDHADSVSDVAVIGGSPFDP